MVQALLYIKEKSVFNKNFKMLMLPTFVCMKNWLTKVFLKYYLCYIVKGQYPQPSYFQYVSVAILL